MLTRIQKELQIHSHIQSCTCSANQVKFSFSDFGSTRITLCLISPFRADVTISQQQDPTNRLGRIKQQNPPHATALRVTLCLQHYPAGLSGSLDSSTLFRSLQNSPIKTSMEFSKKTEKTIQKYLWNHKRP